MSDRLRLTIRNEEGGTSLTRGLVERFTIALRDERHVGVVTLESDGHAFCEGLDLGALSCPGADSAAEAQAALGAFADLLTAIERAPRPVVALVDGPALGGGVGLVAAADLVLVTSRATFGLPETLLGLIPAMVFPVLARRVGAPRARWLALGAAPLSAAEAWRMGLVDEVGDDLERMLARYAHRFARMDPRAVAELKCLVAEHHDAPAGYRAAAAARFERLLESAETRERLRRFAHGNAPWPDSDAP